MLENVSKKQTNRVCKSVRACTSAKNLNCTRVFDSDPRKFRQQVASTLFALALRDKRMQIGCTNYFLFPILNFIPPVLSSAPHHQLADERKG